MKLPFVSTYHYKSFEDVEDDEKLVQMFLSCALAAVLVREMEKRETFESVVNEAVADYVLEGLVELGACADNSSCEIVH